MAKITGNEISPGTLIEFEGQLWIAVKTQKVKPGKGGAYNQVELKNVTSGTKLNQRFRSDEAVDEAILDKKDFQFLFASGDMLTFMDMETYDQIELATDFVGEQAQFLQDGMKTLVQLYDGKPIGIKLPVQVTLTVAEAELGATRRLLDGQIAEARSEVVAAAERTKAYGTEILPRFEENLTLLRRSFELGEIDILALSTGRERFLRIQSDALLAAQDYFTALAGLERVVGIDLWTDDHHDTNTQ